ncbi:MAG: kelch repeat-containing protein [Phycisphaerales bacterium]
MRKITWAVLGASFVATSLHAANWEPIASLPAAKGDAFGVLWNGSFYVLGGPPWQNGGDQDGSAYKLSGGWSMTAPMDGVGPFVSQGGGVDSTNHIFVFGGLDPSSGDGGPSFTYDPSAGATTSLASRPASAPKQGFAFCADGSGRIYSIGGGSGAGSTNSAFVARYNASTNTWTTLAALPAAVAQSCAAYDGEGHIFVFGGFNANGSARVAEVQRFDVTSGTWSNSNVPDMPVALSGAVAVRGDDHRIYVIGGVNSAGAVQNTTYVLDVWSNSWSVGPTLATARERASATLGDDERIYVAGGKGAGGVALSSGERLYTPPCPTITQQPTDVAGWSGMSVGFSVSATGGTPLSYQWRRDGRNLANGAMASGGIVSGATTPVLAIASPTPADIGAYDVVVATPCGGEVSTTVTFSLQASPTMPSTWTAHSMHPSWANWSGLATVRGDVCAGTAWMPFESWSMIAQPTVWHGTDAESATNLVPPGSAGGEIYAMEGDTYVGWWWWPYSCSISGQLYTCYDMEAASWSGATSQHKNLQVSGWEFSEVTAISNGIKGGYVWTDDFGPDTYTFNAGMWVGPNDTWVPLQPAGIWRSIIVAADGARQFGWTFLDGSTNAHAAGWTGSVGSYVDMNPPTVPRSLLHGAGGGQQVGTTGYVNLEHAGVWAGSASAYRDLHPAGFTESAAYACSGGYQVGTIELPSGIGHAAIWAGGPETVVDLHAFLPANYTGSAAYGVDVGADGTVTVVGNAYNAIAGREEAMLWSSARRTIVGDLDGDGHVGGADIALLLGAWGTSDQAADLNGNGIVDAADLAVLLGAWS